VVDEYGEVEGLVTVTDLLEAMVGDLPDKNEQANPLAVKRSDDSWLLDGLLSMSELQSLLALDTLPEGAGTAYQSVGGFIIDQLEHIPRPSEKVIWENLSFEVVDMDGQRVDKVLLSIKDAGPESASAEL
jgi:putative hemolysin